MQEKSKIKNVRKGIIIGCGISALLLIGFLSSYAFFISTGTSNPENISTITGTLALIFADGNPGITEALEFGSSVEKTFTIENTGSLEGVAKINFEDLVNTYLVSSLTYTLSYSETENGTYKELVENENIPVSETSSTQLLADNLIIPAGTKYFYKLTITLNYLDDIDQTADLNAIFSTHFKLEEGKKLTSKDTLENLNLRISENNPIDFTAAALTDETANGLFTIDDDYGTSYYYRGAVENNYVKFAGFYWRIARINGDGSLRIVYDGTSPYANGTVNSDRVAFYSKWNTTSNDAKYAGYMYGGKNGEASTSKEQAQTNETNSEIKTALDEWYKTNIVDKNYDKYIADNIFCNDRKASEDLSINAGLLQNTGLGYGNNATVFNLINDFKNINAKCEQQNDRFTVNDVEKGNGSLTYPVGLLSFDEFLLAGSGYSTEWYKPSNTQFYLYKGVWQWTMTPSYFGDYKTGLTSFFHTYLNYYNISNDRSYSNNGVAPVINLSARYVKTLIGDGTSSNPYRSPDTNL